MAVKALINLTHGGPPVWFLFDGSGTVGDPASVAGTSPDGSIIPVNPTNAGPLSFFQFFGSGTTGDPFTIE